MSVNDTSLPVAPVNLAGVAQTLPPRYAPMSPEERRRAKDERLLKRFHLSPVQALSRSVAIASSPATVEGTDPTITPPPIQGEAPKKTKKRRLGRQTFRAFARRR